MVVAVEHGLEDISRQLRERGYITVSYPEYTGVVDAFVYKDKIPTDAGTDQGNQLQQSIENHMFSRPQGVLIISSTNKTIGQIDQILQTRVYSPLF